MEQPATEKKPNTDIFWEEDLSRRGANRENGETAHYM